ADPEILLQKRDALIHAGFQALASHQTVRMAVLLEQLLARRAFGRVGIETHAVAELATEHLISRYAVSLACQIPQRHLNAAHASGLPRGGAELFNLAEYLVHVARVLAEDARFENQRINLAPAVAHFAVTGDALVGVNADEGDVHRRPGNDGDAQIGDLELGGDGIALNVFNRAFHILIRKPAGHAGANRGCAKSLKERSPAVLTLDQPSNG